jgi:hypothetical protein
MEHVRADAQGLPVLRSQLLAVHGFRHGFSIRAGGVSEPPFETADFALLRDEARLAENIRRLGQSVGFRAEDLHQARQVNGRAVVVADGQPDVMATREADALVAEPGSGHAVAVRVADCVPVLIGDPATGRVAAVHAGWQGIENQVLQAAIEKMGDSDCTRASWPQSVRASAHGHVPENAES